MRRFQFAIAIITALVGAGSAFADHRRISSTYVNVTMLTTYTLISNFNPAKCKKPDTRSCYWTCPVYIGPHPTLQDLINAGCTPSAVKAIYVP